MDIEERASQQGIEGVWFQSLQIMPAKAGDVLHGLRPGYALAPKFSDGFGELYFSEVRPGYIKAWKRHRRQKQLFMVPVGLLQLILYDDRPNSPTKGMVIEKELGRPKNYGLLSIPAGIWYGFRAISEETALICNYASIPHDPLECEILELHNNIIPHAWAAGQSK